MTLIKNVLLSIIFLSVMTTNITAQKIGHANTANLLALMPEAARADSVLMIYRNQKLFYGDSIAKAFEANVKVFVEANKAGTLTGAQSQKRQEELQKTQQYLQNYSQQMEQDVNTVRRTLLQPLIAKLDAAVSAVGKENGYHVIFDTGNSFTLFAAESEDVTTLVKNKLGIK